MGQMANPEPVIAKVRMAARPTVIERMQGVSLMRSSTDRHFPREGSQATPRAAEIRRHSRAVTMPGSGSGPTRNC
ncbi:Uncharacterised protein [Mycobacteroides abscessus]|nr:Uncharacterised protein [Mycobacteroides abscessus]